MDAFRLKAMEAMLRALKVVKAAKKRGIDVRPYRRRMKEAQRLFQGGDYQGTINRMEQIILEIKGQSRPPG